jgi:ABC-2 type transport system ATP-binding protein
LQFLEKIKEVEKHFSNKDLSQGFRQLVDCVLDTKDKNLYREIIQIATEREDNSCSDEKFISLCESLISKLLEFNIAIPSDNKLFLEVTNLHKSYGRNRFQIKNVNFKLFQGEIFGLVGENGNGKTTLLRVLANELEVNSGEINYSFLDSNSQVNLNSELCYIPQRTSKWFGSLKSNLKFAASHYGIKGEENELLTNMYIIRFGLWKFRNHQWSELSSGYKMRFELARTFLRSPKLLFLDEPLANLDVLAQQQVLDDLKNLTKSLSNPIAIILSSQQLFEVERIADQVIFLKNGVPSYREDLINKKKNTFIEADIRCSKNELSRTLESLPVLNIQHEGGSFLISFEEGTKFKSILEVLSKSIHEIIYIRDISDSTRTLFMKQTKLP